MPIARLRGTVEDKGEGWLIIGVGGMGIMASVPATASDAAVVGQPVLLFTYLHVREDALQLFGFASADDLRLFEQLIGISGVGPRAALGLLSALDYAALTTALAAGHVDALRRVPGIGQKTAERLVLELRDKVTPPAGEDAPAAKPPERILDEELIGALMGLGYTQAESAAAAERVAAVDGEGALEERIRLALSMFTKP